MIIKTKQKFNLNLIYLILKPLSIFRGYSQSLYFITKFLPDSFFKVDANIEIFNKKKFFNVNIKYPYMLDVFLKNKCELTVPALIIKLLKKNSSFVDIGANCGWYTKIISLFRNDVNIYCFEPSKKAFEELIKIASPQILIFPFAVSYSDNKRLFSSRNLWSQESSTKFFENKKIIINHSVISIKLDTFFLKHKIYPSIIKIDTEGGELNVLRGAKTCLAHADYVILEVNEDVNCEKFNYKYIDIYEHLFKFKFKYFYQISNKYKSVMKPDKVVTGDVLFSKTRIKEFEK